MNYDELMKKTLDTADKEGPKAAMIFISDFIDKNQNNSDAYLIRSEFCTELGDLDGALEDAEKAVRLNPKDADVYNNRGCVYVRSANVNAAMRDFNKAIELNPKNVKAYSNRANVYLKMRDTKKAIEDCTRAIEISPDKVEPYYNRGLAYMNSGETEKALDDYNKCVAIDPQNAEALVKRGAINSQLGNTQEAISDFEEFLRLDPDNENAGLVKSELSKLKSGKPVKGDKGSANVELRMLLICSAIGFILGTIFGIMENNIFGFMWVLLGLGVAVSDFISGDFMRFYRKWLGFIATPLGIIVWVIILILIYMFGGLIGFIIRFIKKR